MGAVISTQREFDKLPDDYGSKIFISAKEPIEIKRKFSNYVTVLKGFVTARGNAWIVAHGNSTITAYGNCTIEACDNTTVILNDNCTAAAFNNSIIKTAGTGEVQLYDDAVQIKMRTERN